MLGAICSLLVTDVAAVSAWPAGRTTKTRQLVAVTWLDFEGHRREGHRTAAGHSRGSGLRHGRPREHRGVRMKWTTAWGSSTEPRLEITTLTVTFVVGGSSDIVGRADADPALAAAPVGRDGPTQHQPVGGRQRRRRRDQVDLRGHRADLPDLGLRDPPRWRQPRRARALDSAWRTDR